MHRPGETVPISGIYACTGCRNEVTCVRGEPFPPCRRCGTGAGYRLIRAAR